MRIKSHEFFALFVFVTFASTASHAAVSSLSTGGSNIRPISQYGLIQNVQDYSSNPFWTPGSPYNQKFPQAVYVDGPELNTADCQSAVGTLVSSYCSANNDCIGLTLSDIRPFVMLQLSRMPGHNYASSCSGFIDSEFESYVAEHSSAVPNKNVSFPGATEVNPDFDAPEFKLENPYEYQDGTWKGEEWKKEKRERYNELKDLQAQNGAGTERLAKSDFPTTFADLSFTERNEIKAAGYEPFKGQSAFRSIKVESEESAEANRQRRIAFCQNRYGTILATLNEDLQTLNTCKSKGTPISQCKTKGKY